MNNFFITGLPRSRTAWFAAFFNTDDVFCYHEGLGRFNSISDYLNDMSNGSCEYKGDSNTYYLAIKDSDLVNNSPLVIIHNDMYSSIISSINLMNRLSSVDNSNRFNELEDLYLQNEELLEKADGLHIDKNDIDDNLKEIWEYCIGDSFNEKRTNELIKMNIQTNNFQYNKESINKVMLWRS